MRIFDYLMAVVGAAAGAGACLLWAFVLHGPAEYAAGQDAERTAARVRAMELIEKRAEDNAEISKMDASRLCVELDGVWVSDEVGCR